MTQTIAAPRDVIAGEIAGKLTDQLEIDAYELAQIVTTALVEAGYRIVRDEPVAVHAMGSEEGEDFVRGFMCLTDFSCELGLASGGNVVFPSIDGVKDALKCVASCGIVEVQVRATQVVQPAAEYEEGEEATNGE